MVGRSGAEWSDLLRRLKAIPSWVGWSGRRIGKRLHGVFVGMFEHVLDEKGRVVLPTSFRGRLADGGFLGTYDSALALWTPEDFEGFVNRMTERVRDGEVRPSALRALTAQATDVRPDSQGRILVHPRLRAHAALERDVVLVGSRDHIEIWDDQRWAEASALDEVSLAEAVGSGI